MISSGPLKGRAPSVAAGGRKRAAPQPTEKTPMKKILSALVAFAFIAAAAPVRAEEAKAEPKPEAAKVEQKAEPKAEKKAEAKPEKKTEKKAEKKAEEKK